ncbi:MAG: 2-succinyl-6-hydroxy-2,4-cyclohexadiene-1-carboxy late synthase [Anaerolineales bacterium]
MNAEILTLGESSRPPLVFLHGFLGSGKSWLPIAQEFASAYFCVLLDLPGHGLNAAGDLNSPLSFEDTSQFIHRALDALRLGAVTLAGYSMGGRAALAYAARHPSRIRALILESAHPGIEEEAQRAQRREEDAARAAFMLKHGMAAFVERWYESPLFASLKERPSLKRALRKSAEENNPDWMAKTIQELSPGKEPALWEILPALTFPVLLIAGGKDAKYCAALQRAHSALPNAQLKIVSRAGHNVHAEEPEAYCQILRAWLNH